MITTDTQFAVAAKSDPMLSWFAIADCAQHPSLPQALTADGETSSCLFDVASDSPVAQFAPHLVQLSPPLVPCRAWRWILSNASSGPFVSIIASRAGFADLLVRLREAAEVLLPDGDSMFLAYWDPAILGTLLGQADDQTLQVSGPVLTDSQQGFLLGRISAWWYWDRSGQMHLARPSAPSAGEVNGPLSLSQGQVDDLVEASVPDHILFYLERNHPEIFGEKTPMQRYTDVRTALAMARDIGLTTMKQLVNFACLSQLYGERLSEDRTIVELLQSVRFGRRSFDQILHELP